MNNAIRVLYVDDSPFDRALVRDALEIEHGGFALTEAASRADFERLLAQGGYDLVLSDFNILGFDGLQVLEIVQAQSPQTPVVIVTGTGSEEVAVEAMKRGADDYVIKTPSHIRRLPHTIHAVLEKRQAEFALRESETFHRQLISGLPVTIYVTDAQGYLTLWNQAAVEMWGRTPVAGQDRWCGSWKLYTADGTFLPHAECPMAEAITEQKVVRGVEAVGERPDGSRFYFLANATPLYDAAGRFKGAMNVMLDITEPKRSEENLRRSEERFRSWIENSSDLVTVLGENGTIQYASPSYAHVLGYMPEELIGIDAFDLVHPDDIAHTLKIFGESIETIESSATLEFRYRHKDGSWRMFEALGKAYTDERGQMAGLINSRDITERKQAEEALRESEERLSLAVSASGQALWDWDITRDDTYLSPKYYELLGYAEGEIQPDYVFFQKIVHPDDLPAVNRVMEEHFLGKSEYSLIEYRMQMESGDYRWVQGIGKVVERDEKNSPVRMVGFVSDITERKQPEEALRDSQTRVAGIINSAMDAIISIDRFQQILIFNPAAEVMFGCDSAAAIGQPLANFLPERFRANHAGHIQHFAQTGVTSRVMGKLGTIYGLRSNGEEFPIEASISQTHVADQPEYTVILRDVTERKQAEEALAQQHTLLRTVIDNLPDAVYIKDTEARKVLVNRVDLELIGMSEEQVLGKTDWDLFPAEIAALFYAADQSVLQSGQAVLNHENLLVNTNGQERWLLSSKIPLRDSQGRITGLVGISHDITERKQAEETLRQRLTELEALHRVSAALRTAESREQVLPILLNETLTALGLVSGTIWFYYPKQNELRADFSCGGATRMSQTPMQPGEGMVGFAFASGQIHLSHEIRTDPLARPHIRAEAPPDWGGVFVPIRAGALVIGIFFVAVPTAHPLISEQMRLLESLVEMSGSALHRLRLHEETVRRLAHVQALHAIDVAITSTLDLPQTLNVVLEQTTAQLGMDAASILLFDPDSQLLIYAAGRGFRTRAIEQSRIGIGEGFAGKAMLEEQMVHYPDLLRSEEFTRIALLADEGFVDYYAVPLIAKERIVGVLEVFQRTAHQGDTEWQAFLETLAGQAAIAVENDALFAESQRLLQEAQGQAQLTQEIIDSAPEGMLVLDSQQRLVLANPVARAYLPVLATVNLGDLLTHLGEQPLANFLRSFANQQPWNEASWGKPPRIYEVAAQPLSAGQQAGGWVLVLRDVTVERDRQRYQQAQDRLATVGQLAAGIAHDFNNIMGAIVLYTQLLRNDAHFSTKQQQYLGVIYDQSHHAADLIRQILDFSRSAPMDRAALDVMPLVKELVKLLERTLPENITIELAYDRNEYVINGDPTRLQQMLMNLALNARDAMPRGGTLSFQLATLSVAPGQAPPLPDMAAGEWVQLTVADTGTGIEAEHLAHLFEPFFTTKQPGQGTGLGLAQVYGIVKQHDGSIAVESQVGRGTAFIAYLPLHSAAPPPTQPAREDERLSGDGETILLVEDNPSMRMAVSESLEGLGYRVFSASDGVEALELLSQQANTISLMLSDLVMPRMGGVELSRAARLRYPTLKIVIMTGHPLHESEDELRQAGIEGWMRKPFSINELADQVQAVLGAR